MTAAPSGNGLWGLSPRVRGNHNPAVAAAPAPGSIPACAGEPAGRRGTKRVEGVYPRVCGGTHNAVARQAMLKGLSPRVRGNRMAKEQPPLR